MAEILVRVSDDPIDAAEALRFVTDPALGGVAVFAGNVRSPNDGRDVERIEYSAYREMAEAELRKIARETGAARVWIAHRTGALRPAETSVLIAVATPHRADAFTACRYAIEELKKRAPIFKKEVNDQGEQWIPNPGEGERRTENGEPGTQVSGEHEASS